MSFIDPPSVKTWLTLCVACAIVVEGGGGGPSPSMLSVEARSVIPGVVLMRTHAASGCIKWSTMFRRDGMGVPAAQGGEWHVPDSTSSDGRGDMIGRNDLEPQALRQACVTPLILHHLATASATPSKDISANRRGLPNSNVGATNAYNANERPIHHGACNVYKLPSYTRIGTRLA